MRALFHSGLFVLLACSKAPEPDPRARCAAASARDVGVTVHRRGGSADAIDQELEAALAGVCVADRWSEAIITCFTSDPDLTKCRAMLTPEQRTTYTRRRMEINSKRVGRPRPGSGAH
jgi:hypothetical protein